MNKENQDKLFEKYPKIFRQKDLSMDQTCMCWGIECGDGWYPILDALCAEIQIRCNQDLWIYDQGPIKRCLIEAYTRVIWNPILSKFAKWYYLRRIPNSYTPAETDPKELARYRDAWKRHSAFTNRFLPKVTYRNSGAKKYPQVEFTQVKEKFGTLRVYAENCDEGAYAAIAMAERWSETVCEDCGSNLNVSFTKGWIRCLCAKCQGERLNR